MFALVAEEAWASVLTSATALAFAGTAIAAAFTQHQAFVQEERGAGADKCADECNRLNSI